jgi:hypothetical protein
MLNFLKKLLNPADKPNGEAANPAPQMVDLYGEPLAEGDAVTSLRYDLGECQLLKVGGVWHYQSSQSGQQVSWAKMIDAATGFQKVVKVSKSA